MNRDQILRRNDEITAETDAVIRRGKEIVSKLESGAIKPDDPQVKEVLQQLIERRRIGNEFNAELTRLVHEQSDEPTRTPRLGIPHIPRGCPSRQSGRLGWLLASIVSKIHNGYTKGKRLRRCRYPRRSNDSLYRLDKTPKNR